jgi:hypothetical protein
MRAAGSGTLGIRRAVGLIPAAARLPDVAAQVADLRHRVAELKKQLEAAKGK